MNENGKKEALQLWLLAFEQLTKNIDIQKWDLKGLKGEFEDALLLSDGHFTEEIQVKSSVAFGADANMIKLKEISSKVFDSAEIFQVLHFMKKVDAIKQELETLNPEFATPFKEHLRRLEEYYFDPQTDKDFKKEILDFFGRLNDSIPEKLQQEFVKLPMDFLLSRCLGSLEKDFQKTIFKNLTNPKTLIIVARASWINEKFLKNLMAQTSLEQQKGFLKCIEECLKDLKSFYFSSACELLLAFLSYRNAKRELELIPESEKTMRLLDSIDKAIKKRLKLKAL